MKKIFCIILTYIIITGIASYAEGDLWDGFGDQNFYGTKQVSDKDFEKALEIKKGTKKPKKTRGETFRQSNETEIINQKAEELPVVCVSSDVKIDEQAILPVGHYQVTSEKVNGKIYLKLYQGHYLMAELEATETLDDFDQPEINFADFITDGNIYKLIYGSVDFNAFVNLEPVNVD